MDVKYCKRCGLVINNYKSRKGFFYYDEKRKAYIVVIKLLNKRIVIYEDQLMADEADVLVESIK